MVQPLQGKPCALVGAVCSSSCTCKAVSISVTLSAPSLSLTQPTTVSSVRSAKGTRVSGRSKPSEP